MDLGREEENKLIAGEGRSKMRGKQREKGKQRITKEANKK